MQCRCRDLEKLNLHSLLYLIFPFCQTKASDGDLLPLEIGMSISPQVHMLWHGLHSCNFSFLDSWTSQYFTCGQELGHELLLPLRLPVPFQLPESCSTLDSTSAFANGLHRVLVSGAALILVLFLLLRLLIPWIASTMLRCPGMPQRLPGPWQGAVCSRIRRLGLCRRCSRLRWTLRSFLLGKQLHLCIRLGC